MRRKKNKVNFVSLHGSLLPRVQRSGRHSVGQQTGTMRSDDLPGIITAPPTPTTAAHVFQFFFLLVFFARFIRCRDFSHDLFFPPYSGRLLLFIVPQFSSAIRYHHHHQRRSPLCGFPISRFIRTKTAAVLFKNLNSSTTTVIIMIHVFCSAMNPMLLNSLAMQLQVKARTGFYVQCSQN